MKQSKTNFFTRKLIFFPIIFSSLTQCEIIDPSNKRFNIIKKSSSEFYISDTSHIKKILNLPEYSNIQFHWISQPHFCYVIYAIKDEFYTIEIFYLDSNFYLTSIYKSPQLSNYKNVKSLTWKVLKWDKKNYIASIQYTVQYTTNKKDTVKSFEIPLLIIEKFKPEKEIEEIFDKDQNKS